MTKTTRYRLIEYLQVKKVSSAAELARVLKITAADARHHLTSLEDEGVVVVVDTRVQGRGRPTQMYRLSREINRHNLDSLITAVLTVWLDGTAVDRQDAAFDKIATYIASGCKPPQGNLTQRLTNAVRCLNEMNYMARWEAHIDAPRVLITHCPYASVVAKHPEICQMDAFVIKKILGQSVTPISTDRTEYAGEIQCVFCLDPSALAIDTPITAK
jgi:predicted ArsR family transcriptional regulator